MGWAIIGNSSVLVYLLENLLVTDTNKFVSGQTSGDDPLVSYEISGRVLSYTKM